MPYYSSVSHVSVKPHYKPRPEPSGRKLDLPTTNRPGKFQGELRISEPIWELTLQGGDGLGDAETFGYFSYMELGPDAVDDIAAQASESNITLTANERFFIASQAGAIVQEDSSGFVYVEYFDSKEVLDDHWNEIEVAWEEFNAEDGAEFERDEDDDGGYVTPGNDPTMPSGGPPVYHGPEERYGG